jgi:hypothetical protein
MRVLKYGLLLAVAGWATAASADDRRFDEPRWFDDRLDWCLNWGTDCGKPAADNFCKRRRYTGARDFAPAPGIGRTRVSGNNQLCTGSFCVGFAHITCFGSIPAERVFANPTVRHGSRVLRLDWCATWGTNCGKTAADAFCLTHGFTQSFYWVKDAVPGNGPTFVPNPPQVCKGSFCTGFQMIICE